MDQKNNEEKYSGLDDRPINDNDSNVDIDVIRGHFYKSDLLKLLESDLLDENQKLSIVYRSALFDEFNPSVIRAPNLTKGLKW
jgi:hypothetical protein